MAVQFLVILNMHEIDKTKLTNKTKFKLYKIKKGQESIVILTFILTKKVNKLL